MERRFVRDFLLGLARDVLVFRRGGSDSVRHYGNFLYRHVRRHGNDVLVLGEGDEPGRHERVEQFRHRLSCGCRASRPDRCFGLRRAFFYGDRRLVERLVHGYFVRGVARDVVLFLGCNSNCLGT